MNIQIEIEVNATLTSAEQMKAIEAHLKQARLSISNSLFNSGDDLQLNYSDNRVHAASTLELTR